MSHFRPARFAVLWLKCVFVFVVTSGLSSYAAAVETLEQQLMREKPAALAAAARREGNPAQGAVVFHRSMMACAACHSVGEQGDSIGPNLAKLDKKTSDASLVESILEPSKVIAPAYAATTIETKDGQVLTGILAQENAQQVLLRDTAHPEKTITIAKSDIADRQVAKLSVMPAGQVNQLAARRQFLDLVRYVIELRDGGSSRAQQLQPPPWVGGGAVPDQPLANRPAVQRGELQVDGSVHYPRAVALGFVDGTVVFDADQLATVATWNGGFVKSSPQTYFGLFWHRDGGPAEPFSDCGHQLGFKFADEKQWQSFEPPPTSDPNLGSRFDGYQIGRSSVRLHYHVMVGGKRIAVTEDVRAESRPAWQGFARDFRFTGLPAGAVVAIALPAGDKYQWHTATGEKAAPVMDVARSSFMSYRTGGTQRVARAPSHSGATWLAGSAPGDPTWRLVSAPAREGKPLGLRVDLWKYRGLGSEAAAAELASLEKNLPQLDDAFDQTLARRTVPPAVDETTAATAPPKAPRPAVNSHSNVDEFPTTRGRFLRFVITKTNDGTQPGLDELDVYGANPKVNLALKGKATASSVLPGYVIHTIPHLNDGKLGNAHSWISNEAGGGWAQIEFPQPVEMSKIVWARDRTGTCKDRLAVAYRVEVSSDGQKWTKVADEGGRASRAAASPPIRTDAAPGYIMESIPSPFPGCRPSDIAFSDDDTMYAIAMTQGQIWRTRTPPPGHPQQVRWQRFASGLFHPIGLAIVDGHVYVAQKPEITELIDRDGDGVVDHYRTVATGWGLSTGWHEYTFGLAVDPQKNLWFALNTGHFWPPEHDTGALCKRGRWRGSVLRVAHESEKLEVAATGCRVPNGVTLGPGGNIFYTDNQGDWIPNCKLACVTPGRFYGHPEDPPNMLPAGSTPDGRTAVWLPYDLSRSTSGPVHDRTGGTWGPFADQLFVGDVGYGANTGIMRVALEKIEGEYQGACFKFIDGQPLGCERMKFGPDNLLYIASLSSGLIRMSYTAKSPPLALQAIHIRPRGQGFVVQLTKPLAVETKLDPKTIHMKHFHFQYWRTYGSPHIDEKTVSVEAVEMSADRTKLTLTLPVEAWPTGMVYEMNLGQLTGADGEKLLHNEAWYTVQRIPQL
ncbi:MAG: discoidin domain-containing protein [Planctomycetia bacterium]|nr:discoidin domain-containing protein [Planctomycetia bacterium]